MNTWKSPENLRLSRIEKWAKARLERRKRGKDIAATTRAANFYNIIASRAYRIAQQNVASFEQRNAEK